MKKARFLLLLIICVNSYLIAQSTITKGIVVYNYIFSFDTIGGTSDIETESFLYFDTDKHQSIYVWNRKSKAKSQKLITTGNGITYLKVKNGGSDPIGNIIFKDYTNNNILLRDYGREIKIISDSYTINWEITEESKTFQNMVLQKAECDFRGRHYIAWFNPKISIPDGPWKLRGLPGLIIEAYDEKKHIQFNFTSLTLPADFTEKIEAPSEGKHVVYDCKQFTIAHYDLIRELTKGVVAKAQQMGATTEGASGVMTNTIERCY
jgi:GLPGLI family protein